MGLPFKTFSKTISYTYNRNVALPFFLPSHVLGTVWIWINVSVQCSSPRPSSILLTSNISLRRISLIFHNHIICVRIHQCNFSVTLRTKYDHENLTYYNNKFPSPNLSPQYQILIDRDEMEMMVYPGLVPSIWPKWDPGALLGNLIGADFLVLGPHPLAYGFATTAG